MLYLYIEYIKINTYEYAIIYYVIFRAIETAPAPIEPNQNNLENEEDNDGSQSPEREASAFLEECKKDAGKRRASLAAKMTSNLRRLSGAADLKIDINDPVSSNNPKYCNKKIKVSNRKNRKYQHTRLQAGRFDQ